MLYECIFVVLCILHARYVHILKCGKYVLCNYMCCVCGVYISVVLRVIHACMCICLSVLSMCWTVGQADCEFIVSGVWQRWGDGSSLGTLTTHTCWPG